MTHKGTSGRLRSRNTNQVSPNSFSPPRSPSTNSHLIFLLLQFTQLSADRFLPGSVSLGGIFVIAGGAEPEAAAEVAEWWLIGLVWAGSGSRWSS